MAGSLQEFIATVGNYGVAKNNRFMIEFPSAIISDQSIQRLLTFYANRVTLSGRNITTMPVRYGAKPHSVPTDFLFDEKFSITFYVDRRHIVKSVMEVWLNSVVDNNSNVMSYYDDYVTDMIITELSPKLLSRTDGDSQPFKDRIIEAFKSQLNGDGNVADKKLQFEESEVARHHYVNVYPVAIGPLTLSNEDPSIQTITVDFAFEYINSTYSQSGTPSVEQKKKRPLASTKIIDRFKNLVPQLQNKAVDVADSAGGILNSVRNLF